jgi:hypothetical protein
MTEPVIVVSEIIPLIDCSKDWGKGKREKGKGKRASQVCN